MIPKIIIGGNFTDYRGTLNYNNEFDATQVKRVYTIKNKGINFIRRWQGHKIEQRWFSVVSGSFRIELIQIDNWENPSESLDKFSFIISDQKMDILHVPPGYVSSIQALEVNAVLLSMADYALGQIDDDYKYPSDYFKD